MRGKETGGPGEAETNDLPVQERDLQQLPTDWPKDFHPLEPSPRPGEAGQDEVTQHREDEITFPESQDDKPTPGTSTGLTRSEGDKSANKKLSAKVLTEGGRDRLNPLITTNINKHVTPAPTRGYKMGEKGQQESVVRQEPEGQHPRHNKTTSPKPTREQASRSRGHSYQPL